MNSPLRRDVGVGAARGVVEAVVLAVEIVDVSLNVLLLIVWHVEVVGEPGTRRETARSRGRDGLLGRKVLGRADAADEGARGGESRSETLLVGPVVGGASAVGTDARISRREEHADPASAELGEAGAHALRIRLRDGLLRVAICRCTSAFVRYCDGSEHVQDVEMTFGRSSSDCCKMKSRKSPYGSFVLVGVEPVRPMTSEVKVPRLWAALTVGGKGRAAGC